MTISYQEQLWFLLDILIATVLGGVIGFERESKNKPAGLRTNMLIAASAATLVIIGQIITSNFQEFFGDKIISTDPIRVIQAIAVGVSFIGAGVIIKSKEKEKVIYLTTAATILFSACTGIAVALHLYIIAFGIALLGLIINFVLKKVEEQSHKS